MIAHLGYVSSHQQKQADVNRESDKGETSSILERMEVKRRSICIFVSRSHSDKLSRSKTSTIRPVKVCHKLNQTDLDVTKPFVITRRKISFQRDDIYLVLLGALYCLLLYTCQFRIARRLWHDYIYHYASGRSRFYLGILISFFFLSFLYSFLFFFFFLSHLSRMT